MRGSVDQTRVLADRYKDNAVIQCLSLPRNIGRSSARDAGCEVARGAIILFIDSDMFPIPGLLSAYELAFQNKNTSVIPGARYNVTVACDGRLEEHLATKVGVDPAAVIKGDVSAQLTVLARQAKFGQYRRRLRRHRKCFTTGLLRQPQSPLCAYSFVISNIAVRRQTWLETRGFDAWLQVEDTEAAFQLYALGNGFAFCREATAYHLYDPQAYRAPTVQDNLALIYRQPYRAVLAMHLWATGYVREDADCSTIDALLNLTAGDSSVSAHILQKPRSVASTVANCLLSAHDIVDYLKFLWGHDASAGHALVEEAVQKGLYVVNERGENRYDLYHTLNWLQSRSPFQQYLLTEVSYIRNHKTSTQRDTQPAKPILRAMPRALLVIC